MTRSIIYDMMPTKQRHIRFQEASSMVAYGGDEKEE